MVDPEPLDDELALASHWVAMSDTEKRPKRGFQRLLILGLIVLAAVLVANLTSPDRYVFSDTTNSGQVILLDGVTGKLWASMDGGLVPIRYK